MKVYTGESIRRIEQACFASGITELRLMENAGVACAKVIRKEYALEENKGKTAVILCGKGKNGGDGLVIARKLYEIGTVPLIIFTHGYPTIAEPVQMLERAKLLGLGVLNFDEQSQVAYRCIADADILVDCIFGIGYRGLADAKTAAIFQAVNNSRAPVISIDVPSGLDSEGDNFDPNHICADLTVTISAFKPVHIRDKTACACGKVVVVNINIEQQFFEKECPVAEITDKRIVKAIMPKRPDDANKGSFGHLLGICGSYRMPGAAVMSAGAAERSGVGKITLAFPDKAYAGIASKLNEAMFLPLPSDDKGFFDPRARDELMEAIAQKTAIYIGPGIGKDIGALALLETVMKRTELPVLVDADGINLLAENIYLLKEREGVTVLTPHPGEFARLSGVSVEKVLQNRAAYAQAFCEKFPHAVLVLKGRNTIVAANGKLLYINPTGNAGLAQGGTGDVLAGLMAGFMAQGIAPMNSAIAAAYIHGEAGEMCAERLSQRGMTTPDLITAIPESLKKYAWE